jgi:hypothetical protein
VVPDPARPCPLNERAIFPAVAATCGHEDVEWTYQRPLPDGARCRACGTWWRLDLIPYSVAERLTGGIPPREDVRPSADERKRS